MSNTDSPGEEIKYPVQQKVTWAGSTAVAMGMVDLFGHMGPTGLVVGGLVSYVAWRHGPEIYEQVREMFSLPARAAQPETIEQQAPRRSWLDRALGRNLESETPSEAAAEEADTVVVPEEEADRYVMDALQPKQAQPNTDQQTVQPNAAQREATIEPQYVPAVDPIFPAYPDRLTLRLGQVIDKPALQTLILAHSREQSIAVPGRRFDPPFKLLLGKGWVAAANQGFGKSI